MEGPGGEGDQINSMVNNQEEAKAGEGGTGVGEDAKEEPIDLEDKITLQSSDMQTREVVRAVACMSELIKG